jgi:hypothetical protein
MNKQAYTSKSKRKKTRNLSTTPEKPNQFFVVVLWYGLAGAKW